MATPNEWDAVSTVASPDEWDKVSTSIQSAPEPAKPAPFYQPLLDVGAKFAQDVRAKEATQEPVLKQMKTFNALGRLGGGVISGTLGTLGNLYDKVNPAQLLGEQPKAADAVSSGIGGLAKVTGVAPAIETAVKAYEGIKNPYVKEGIGIGGTLIGLTPFGRAEKTGVEAVTAAAGKDVAARAEQLAKEAAIKDKNPLNVAQNLQAQRAGIPLTKAQSANPVSGAPLSGVEGAIENTVSGLPGGQGVMVGFKKQQAESAVKSLEKVFGDKLQNIDENYAEKIVADIEQNHALEKEAFGTAYKEALDNGNISYIHGQSVAKNALNKINQMPEATTLDPEFKAKVGGYLAKVRDIDQAVTSKPVLGQLPSSTVEGGYREGMSKTVLGETPAARGTVNTNYDAYRSLQTEILGEKERAWNLVRAGGANKEQARKYANVLNVVSQKMKQNEYAHLRMIGGNDLVKNLKNLDAMYGEEVGTMSNVQKMLGLGKEAGEKGFKESEVALDASMNPKNLESTKLAIDYMSPDTKATFGKALLAKVIRPATKGAMTEGQYTANTIHLATLDNNFNKYRKGLETLLGPDKVSQFDDFLTAAKKAKLQTINLADATNPSGTGFKNAINNILSSIIVGGGVGGSMVHGVQGGAVGLAGTAGLAGLGALGARGFAKRAIAQPVAETNLFKPLFKPSIEDAVSQKSGFLGSLGNQQGAVGGENPISLDQLKTLSPDRWKVINTKMQRAGYDWHGADDAKQQAINLAGRTGGIKPDVNEALYKALQYETMPKATKSIEDQVINKVTRYYGITDNLKFGGYILPNGKMIDLSGVKQGNIGATSRGIDHREIGSALENIDHPAAQGGTEGMNEFLKLGPVRIDHPMGMVDVGKMPTNEQRNAINRFISSTPSETIYIELNNNGGRFYKEYSKADRYKILKDIDNYYSNVEKPMPQSLAQKYHERGNTGLKLLAGTSAAGLGALTGIGAMQGKKK